MNENDIDNDLADLLGDDMDTQQLMAIMKSSMLEKIEAQHRENDITYDGLYRDIEERDFLEITINSDIAIIHFYHKDFERCKKIDKTLKKLSLKYKDVSFMRIEAEKSPFFVNKFNIKVLPTVLCFVDGIKKFAMIGFENLSGDDFSEREFEILLQNKGILNQRNRNTIYAAK